VWSTPTATPSRADQPRFPGTLETEQRLIALVRWNALAMVVRANQFSTELGGHIASYASAADLFEVGFNHFFRAGQAGIWCSSSPIPLPASTPVPSSKGGSTRLSWTITDGKSEAGACRPTAIRT
jgi:Pyruvate dehydrogenase complex, dehydrogenase (E1) component